MWVTGWAIGSLSSRAIQHKRAAQQWLSLGGGEDEGGRGWTMAAQVTRRLSPAWHISTLCLSCGHPFLHVHKMRRAHSLGTALARFHLYLCTQPRPELWPPEIPQPLSLPWAGLPVKGLGRSFSPSSSRCISSQTGPQQALPEAFGPPPHAGQVPAFPNPCLLAGHPYLRTHSSGSAQAAISQLWVPLFQHCPAWLWNKLQCLPLGPGEQRAALLGQDMGHRAAGVRLMVSPAQPSQ